MRVFCNSKNVETIFYFIILRGRLQDTVVIRTFQYDKPRYDLAKKKITGPGNVITHSSIMKITCFISYKILQKNILFSLVKING